MNPTVKAININEANRFRRHPGKLHSIIRISFEKQFIIELEDIDSIQSLII